MDITRGTGSDQGPKRSRRRLPLAIATIVALLLALAGCGSQSGSDGTAAGGEPQRGGVLRLSAIEHDSADGDPTTSTFGGDTLVLERLTALNPDYSAKPVLATEWKASEDGLTWTVEIRQGVTFNDGRDLTPADVVATYERLIAPDSVSPAKGALSILAKAEENTNGTAVDFHLSKPFSDFPFLLGSSNTGILPADYEVGTWYDNPVGTGPFVIENYAPGQGITYQRYEDHWNAEEIYLDGVQVTYYKDQQARVLALQSGEIDGLYGEPISADLLSALDKSQYNVTSVPAAGFSAFVFRVDQPPFDDVKVRQAIAWALDREEIIDTVWNGDAEPGNDTVYGPTFAIRPKSLEQREADPEKVAELLGDKKVEFTITTSSTEETYATLIQQQLEEYDNFDVDIDIQSGAEYYAEGDDSPWLTREATLTFWSPRPSPSQYIDYIYREASDWNASKYVDPELERLSDEYDAATDEAERQRIVDELAEIQWNDVPVIVVGFGNVRAFLDKRVHLEIVGTTATWEGAWIAQ